jgi:hypothetical protein
MPTRSKVFRVMIGSPSDLAEERLAATAAVNEWNAQHADAEGVVLLAVKWETHAMPTSGVRCSATIKARHARQSERCSAHIDLRPIVASITDRVL